MAFTSLNHTVHHYGIVVLWEEVTDVTQFAYLFPTLVVHPIGVYRRDCNDVVVRITSGITICTKLI